VWQLLGEGLERSFPPLRSFDGARGQLPAQAVVDWSYDLLDDEIRPFFCRLSVFSGNFDTDAAHAVCGNDDEFATVDMLAGLVDKSLVVATPQGARTSYRLLETMRQYGATRLAPEEEKQLRDRHCEYFADLAERSWDGIRGRRSQDWLELLDDQFDNLRAAWERALLAQNLVQMVRIAGGLFMYNQARCRRSTVGSNRYWPSPTPTSTAWAARPGCIGPTPST
jgi:predicted ATPase